MDEIQDLKTIAAQFSPGKNVLYVFNKIDLISATNLVNPLSGVAREIYISAKTGTGVDVLKQEIKHCVTASDYSENTLSRTPATSMSCVRQGQYWNRPLSNSSGIAPLSCLLTTSPDCNEH